jgi:heme-degrading monooxygenase HmoA
MVLEVAVLNVKPGQSQAFEAAFEQASPIIAAMPGYRSHELQKCLETPDRYLLLAQWETLEAHTLGFRQSAKYQDWKRLLHHFYDPFPVVEHYEYVMGTDHTDSPTNLSTSVLSGGRSASLRP